MFKLFLVVFKTIRNCSFSRAIKLLERVTKEIYANSNRQIQKKHGGILIHTEEVWLLFLISKLKTLNIKAKSPPSSTSQ